MHLEGHPIRVLADGLEIYHHAVAVLGPSHPGDKGKDLVIIDTLIGEVLIHV